MINLICSNLTDTLRIVHCRRQRPASQAYVKQLGKYDSRPAHRRQECSRAHRPLRIKKRTAAHSVTASSASYDTTLGDLRSVQRSASASSKPAGRTTATGCADFKPLEFGQLNQAKHQSWQHCAKWRMHVEHSMQTHLVELSLLPIGDGVGSRAARPTRRGCAPPSSTGSTPTREVLFNVAHARQSLSQLLQ